MDGVAVDLISTSTSNVQKLEAMLFVSGVFVFVYTRIIDRVCSNICNMTQSVNTVILLI